MNSFLIIGCGAREHSIALSLLKNSDTVVDCIGSFINPGINSLVNTYIKHDISDIEFIKEHCKNNTYHSVIIGPEGPLSNGIVDELSQYTQCIGPTKDLSKIEWSKNYARNLMVRAGLNQYSPDYLSLYPHNQADKDSNYMNIINLNTFINKHTNEIVVKADGLHGGKGVKVWGEHLNSTTEISSYVNEILSNNEIALIEKKLTGLEFSLITITDGKHCKHTTPIMDFKPLYNDNKGPNTGSMGCILDANNLHFLTAEDIITAQNINEKIINYLHNESENYEYYKGFLYGSFMKTENGIKVIEFNSRLGDPEGIALLEQMETSLADICIWMKNDTFYDNTIVFNNKSVICKYAVPEGYPLKKTTGFLDISRLNSKEIKNLRFGSVDENYNMLGSRAWTVVESFNNNIEFQDSELAIDYVLCRINSTIHYRTDLSKMYNVTKISDKYTEAGVNIDGVSLSLNKVKQKIASTHTEEVLSDEASFGGMFSLKNIINKYDDPVLVSSTDGVGTKSEFVFKHMGKKGFYILGQDLVNHSINDILVQGAKPIYFLDYFASSKFNAEYFEEFIKGVAFSCNKYGLSILGGETAEMPGVYNLDSHDFVGTITGVVDRKKIINGKKNVKEGHCIIGLPSNGPHTNGYSLIRKIYNDYVPHLLDLDFKEELCQPHTCYLREIQLLQEYGIDIKGLCHITGGGLTDNPPRVMASNLKIDYEVLVIPELFMRIKEDGKLTSQELFKVFNCGIGMMIFIEDKDKDVILNLLPKSFIIGHVIKK